MNHVAFLSLNTYITHTLAHSRKIYQLNRPTKQERKLKASMLAPRWQKRSFNYVLLTYSMLFTLDLSYNVSLIQSFEAGKDDQF